MSWVVLAGLKTLHQRIKQQNRDKVIFPYNVNGVTFTVLFSTVGSPYELSLTSNGTNLFLLFEIHPGYRVHAQISGEAYRTLARLLRFDGRSGNTLVPSQFLEELDKFMAGYNANYREPTPQEILASRPDLPDRELPYFWHWMDQTTRNQQVSDKNLAKTRLILGPEAEAHSKKNNVSSRWTDDLAKAQNWK
jgi:hypothetical protein